MNRVPPSAISQLPLFDEGINSSERFDPLVHLWMDIFTHAQGSPDRGRIFGDGIFSSFHSGQTLGSSEFCLPVDDHLVVIDVYFILELTQLNIIDFSTFPAFSFFLKGFDFQEII
jgi:hypothetical protein